MNRVTVRDIQRMKTEREPIAMITAYDATSARLSEIAGVPMLLVGDSLGMVIQGHETTIPVTLDHIMYHSEIVVRSTSRALIVGDLPFMTYNISPEQALTNAARLMQEGRVGAVKLEGGEVMAPTITRLVGAGIPVMAHIGLTPQSVNKFGGFRVQGKDEPAARQLLRDARAVQDAGAFAVVLELVPSPLARLITEQSTIATIGIGAGPDCDGQIQVFHDILGLLDGTAPRHTRQYVNAGALIKQAVTDYVADVQQRTFPTQENSFTMREETVAALIAER